MASECITVHNLRIVHINPHQHIVRISFLIMYSLRIDRHNKVWDIDLTCDTLKTVIWKVIEFSCGVVLRLCSVHGVKPMAKSAIPQIFRLQALP